jgi:uncharacterized repeat protein (TIGR03806 family)
VRRARPVLVGLLGLVALAACGGGGGSGGGGTPPPPPPPGSGLDARPNNTSCLAPDLTPPPTASIRVTRVFPALTFTSPVLAVQAPGDSSRWFVVEQAGLVRVFDNVANAAASSVFIDIASRVQDGGERGLLGMAFDPDFDTNGRVFLYYTRVDGPQLQSVLAVYTSPDGGATLDPASESVLLLVDQPANNHNGGHLAFGPADGMLYMALGDGGGAGDPDENGQDRTNLLGKILRLDVSSGTGYSIPAGNRWAGNARCANGAGSTDCPEIHAYGLRNPWRFSFDSATGELWAGDVGQDAWEEIDRIVAGGNYGWDFREGAHCFEPSSNCPTMSDNGDALLDPVAEYDRGLGRSVTGGYVYRGTTIAALAGRYVFGDFVSGRIFAHTPGSGDRTPDVLLDSSLSISSFAAGEDGELYLVDYAGGLYRIEAEGGGGTPTMPDLLSESGCVAASDPTEPASGLIPYRPNAAFWSDGADKARWMALPNGQNISVEVDGDWQFPAGTVLVKNFSLGAQLIETRLFMRHPDGVWAGYTYEWNDAQTEATRVVGGKRRDLGTQEWIYPSESECLQCHTEAAGRVLGLETAQLNGDLSYPQTGRTANQLATLDGIGVLAPPLAGDPSTLPAYPDPQGSAGTVGERARAWLHTNCAGCHRPGGPTGSTLDLRASIALAATDACDVVPASGDLGIADARLIAPGDAARSIVLARANRRDSTGMPPVGSALVDDAGVALLREWIDGLSSCQ